MKIKRIEWLLGCALFFATAGWVSPAKAQWADDFELRQNVGVTWNATKKLGLEARYRLSLNDNASQFNTSMFSLSGEYTLLKWLRLGTEYRFYTSYERDDHRLQLFGRANYKIGKFNLVYRLQYQQTQAYFDKEYLQYYPPRRVFRNRVQLRYSYSKKIELYAFAEPFSRLEHARLNTYRVRYALGGSYTYKKRHSFNPELFLNDEFNIKSPEDRLVVELSYTYDLTRSKKKKAKSAQAPE